jgi:hypothetical protein
MTLSAAVILRSNMKKIIFTVILAISLNAGWYSEKYFISDMQKHIKCRESDKNCNWNANFSYQYYIYGIVDALSDAKYICISNNVNGRQITAIVTKFINDNPKSWNKSSNYLVESALLDAFPCKK